MVLITYFSVTVVGLSSHQVGRRIIDEQINQVLRIQTEGTLDDINKLIFDRFNDMQLLISDSALLNPGVSAEEKSRVLKSRLVTLGWYDAIHFADPEGVVIASSSKSALGADFGSDDWYAEASSRFIHVSDVLLSPFSGKKILAFTNTVQDADSQVIGLLVAEFPLQVLSDLLKRTDPSTEAYLMDQFGQVIAYKGPPAESNPSVNEVGQYQYDPSYLQHQAQSEGYFSFDGNDWLLALQIPKEAAYAPISRFTALLGIILLLIGVPVAILGHFASRRFVRPILWLTEAIAKVRRGQLKQDIRSSAKDEIGYLAQSFNAMTHELDKKTAGLVEEKGKYKSILESSNEAIVLFDRGNRSIAFNARFKELFAKPSSKASRSRNAAGMLHFLSPAKVGEGSQKAAEAIWRIIAEGDFAKSLEAELAIKAPFYAILSLCTKPVLAEGGALLGRIWMLRDITEQAESERSRSEFIKIASHRLRTPITAIRWNSQMLLDGTLGGLSADQAEMVHAIELGADRLNALGNILFNVAEIERGRIPLKQESIPLEDLALSFRRQAKKSAAQQKGAVARAVFGPLKGLRVRGDRKRLEEVFAMLVENALLYSAPKGPARLSLAIRIDKDAKKAVVSLSDKGPGIPPSEQAKVFGKFFRGAQASSVYPDGAGLSLFLAKIILASSGEKIWFESQEGKGSTFHFSLKLIPPALVKKKKAAE